MKKQKTSKFSRTLNRRLATHRLELDIIKIAFFAVAVAALTRFLSYGINSGSDVFTWPNIKKWTLILTLMFSSTAALMYFFASLLKRRNRETTELKAKVVEAIHQALDQSSFNPHLNKHHERFNK